MRILRILVLTLAVLSSPLAHADLVFSAPPRGTEAEERATYEPFVQAMSEWIGTRVVYDYPGDFVTYTFRMRKGQYDLVFDGPHFVAWRMANLHHRVLVDLPEPLVFNVVTGVENGEVNDLDSLINKRVCSLASMQFGTLVVLSQYKLREPELQIVKGEARVAENLQSGQCNVAILRSNVFNRLPEPERAKYKVVFTSNPYPNSAITAGPRLSDDQRRILTARLSDPENSAMKDVLIRFTTKAASFTRAEPTRFVGMDQMLKERVFGW